MVANVKILIYAYGNVLNGEEGASYDRQPLRKIRVKTDASYEDLLNTICTKIETDTSAHQIKVFHRHPESMGGRVRYKLVPILDDDDVEDLIEMAEKMGEVSIQALYIETSNNRSIGLSEHEMQQVDVWTTQAPRSKHNPIIGDEDSIRRRGTEDSPTETGKNLIPADFKNKDPSQNLMIYKSCDPTAFPMPPPPISMDITNGMAEGDQTSEASSSTTPPCGQDYEVFLSFRGIDTRHGFTDHLYNGLVNAGVWVFRDNEELHVGEEIGPELLKAIKSSRTSIPIISKDYASSTWCLKELVQILKCMKTSAQVVLPIFYQVEPSEVRNQNGDFGKGFLLSKEKHDAEGRLVQGWKNALMEVASLKAWESSKIANGYEGELVKMVVHKVLQVLKKFSLVVSDYLVGVEDHVKKIIEWIAAAKGSSDVQAIIIHGMGGIGKTTLAKVVYNRLCNHFECCCFIANIGEASRFKGMEALQKQFILQILRRKLVVLSIDQGANIIKAICKRKKALILLDDIDDRDQLNALAGKSDWFGGGTVIIITSRRKDILKKWEGSYSYELNGLDPNQSFILFCKHAFKSSDSIQDEYKTVAMKIVLTTGGLPLAIEVIGSLLHGKAKDFWEGTLKMLRETPHDKVQSKLKKSFDALEPEEKEIFLDIACLPIRIKEEFAFAFHMWDSFGFWPQVRIEKLISLSLIKIGKDKEPIIHDQLRDLGREIVRQEDINNPGNHSRLWKEDEAWEVVESKQGTRNVQALVLGSRDYRRSRCKSEQFEGMTNLRFLAVRNAHLIGDFENCFLNLRWLCWSAPLYKESDIMGINFTPKRLVILDLCKNNITEYWKGWSQIKDLKVLRISYCRRLTVIPDLSAVKELEVLILHNPTLVHIHPSIGRFSKTLKFLNVNGCRSLEELPIEVGKMEELRELDISDTGIREIPISPGYLTKFEILSASWCTHLILIPDSIGFLVKLQCLDIRGCASLMKISESIGKLKFLTKLDLRYTGVRQLPDSIGGLCNLKELLISFTPIKCFPTSMGLLRKLRVLNLEECRELQSLSNLPCSLTSLKFHGDSMETLPDISNLINLNHLTYMDLFERRNGALNLGKLNQLESLIIYHSDEKRWIPVPQRDIALSNLAEKTDIELENFSLLLELPLSLVKLDVSKCQTLHALPNLSNLKNLSSLHLVDCFGIMEIDGLEGAESLTHLTIKRCRKLSRLGNLSQVKKLTTLRLGGCDKLSDVQGMGKLTSLIEVSFSRCNPNVNIPDLSMLKHLKVLRIKDEDLMEIPWLQEMKSLIVLNISSKSLQYLPDLSQLTEMRRLEFCDCEKLTKIQGLENMTSLESVGIKGCPSLRLPDLPNLWIYTSVFGGNW